MLGNRKVGLRDIPKPRPPNRGVLVQVIASGICRSEMPAYRGDLEKESNEGHEIAGRVVDAGNSHHWKEGDRVGVHAVWGCGVCSWCAAGEYTFCRERRIAERGHSDYVLAPDHVLCRLPDECPFDVGVLLTGCTFAHAFHGNARLQTRAGETVAVIGMNAAGLSHVLLQSWLGATVIAAGVDENCLKLARELGAAQTVSLEYGDVAGEVSHATRGGLADKAIECAGQAETLKLALKCVRPGGRVLCSGEQGTVPLSIGEELIRRDITLTGTWYYHYSEYPRIVECFRAGLPLEKLITHRFDLQDAGEAYRLCDMGHPGKVIFERRGDRS
jgi:propanol-preferring alcohol dehydrogenase